MKSVVETWTCDKCDDQTNTGDGWLSVRWYNIDTGNATIELCPSCFQGFRKWVKQ